MGIERLKGNVLEALRACLAGRGKSAARPCMPTQWPQIDTALGSGLRLGAVHEWIGVMSAEQPLRGTMLERGPWFAPHAIFAHLARTALTDSHIAPASLVVWIGRRCWPFPPALARLDRRLLRHSLLIDARDGAERLWAIDQALRSPAVAAVVGDGSGIDMAGSRRLQLAAECGRALCLLARPARDLDQLSAATTRWLVRPAPTLSDNPRWIVSLLRCKGVQPLEQGPAWALEWDHASCAVTAPAAMVRRFDSTEAWRSARKTA